MKKLLQINVVANSGSTGRITEQLGNLVQENGWRSYIAYGRWAKFSNSELIHIGKKIDNIIHFSYSFLLDNHGLGSNQATRKLIQKIEDISPDIIHLHNIHGYYVNYEILFQYLSTLDIPIVWTLHDCWSFTGHCVHFQNINCNKWKTECHNCPQIHEYPKSLFRDNSHNNYIKKQKAFTSIRNLTIVPVCEWLNKLLDQSFLKKCKRKVILNGIDLNVFYPRDSRKKIEDMFNLRGKFICLAVANRWNQSKGLDDIIYIRKKLPENIVIIMVGVTHKQIENLPPGIIGLKNTENLEQLCSIYSASDVFINPTYQDTLPTVNIESLACGTPVITYNTGGCSDIVDINTGYVISQGDKDNLYKYIIKMKQTGKRVYSTNCVAKAQKCFNAQVKYQEYIQLYNELLNK